MSAEPIRKAGRPSPYAGRELDISATICQRLRGGEPLAQILRENSMPSYWAIQDWRALNPEIEQLFVRAREEGHDVIAADCLLIADNSSSDFIATEDGEKLDAENIQRSKLRVETRLKLLAKWDPKRYGDTAASTTVNVGVQVTNISVTEEQMAGIREKLRLANERAKAISSE